jgi:hypothetical protein
MKNKKNRVLIFVVGAFVLWEIVLALISFLSPVFLSLQERFAYFEKIVVNPSFFWNRANFDGVHYLFISRFGYGLYQQAFFPFYPNLIRWLTPLFGGKDLLAGIFISNLSLLVLLFIFYKLAELDFGQSAAKWSVIFLLVFPAAFFFGMVYTESLFLMLVLASFYSARKGRWLIAGIMGALASYTRVVGVFIFPALLYEWYQQRQESRISKYSFWPIFLVPLGLLNYMRFLGEKYHDSLMFFHVQPYFGAGRTGGKFILIYQVFWRYLKMIAVTKLDYLFFTVWLEFLVSVGFLVLIVLAHRRKIRISYLIFSLLAYVVPTLSGTFLSMPRYVLALFPGFIYLGLIKNNFLKYLLLVAFSLVFVISAALFFRGYWVS